MLQLDRVEADLALPRVDHAPDPVLAGQGVEARPREATAGRGFRGRQQARRVSSRRRVGRLSVLPLAQLADEQVEGIDEISLGGRPELRLAPQEGEHGQAGPQQQGDSRLGNGSRNGRDRVSAVQTRGRESRS